MPLMVYLLRPPFMICGAASSKGAGRLIANPPQGVHPLAATQAAHLARDGDLLELLIAKRPFARLAVVEDERHRRLAHASIALLVDQLPWYDFPLS